MFYACKIVPQRDTDKNDISSNKMAVKVTKKVKYAMALHHIINATMQQVHFTQKASCFFHTFWTMPPQPATVYQECSVDLMISKYSNQK